MKKAVFTLFVGLFWALTFALAIPKIGNATPLEERISKLIAQSEQINVATLEGAPSSFFKIKRRPDLALPPISIFEVTSLRQPFGGSHSRKWLVEQKPDGSLNVSADLGPVEKISPTGTIHYNHMDIVCSSSGRLFVKVFDLQKGNYQQISTNKAKKEVTGRAKKNDSALGICIIFNPSITEDQIHQRPLNTFLTIRKVDSVKGGEVSLVTARGLPLLRSNSDKVSLILRRDNNTGNYSLLANLGKTNDIRLLNSYHWGYRDVGVKYPNGLLVDLMYDPQTGRYIKNTNVNEGD